MKSQKRSPLSGGATAETRGLNQNPENQYGRDALQSQESIMSEPPVEQLIQQAENAVASIANTGGVAGSLPFNTPEPPYYLDSIPPPDEYPPSDTAFPPAHAEKEAQTKPRKLRLSDAARAVVDREKSEPDAVAQEVLADDGLQLQADDILDFMELPIPEREYILYPIICKQSLLKIYASRGVGKTHVAFHIAHTIATGGRLFKWNADKPRKVLYIDGEMPQKDVQDRFRSIFGATGKRPEKGFLRIITPDRQHPELPMPNLATKEGQALVERCLDGVDIVIIDSIFTLIHTGNLNDADSWTPVESWLLNLRRRGIAVLLIHHANKSNDSSGSINQDTVLETIIELLRPKAYKASEGARFIVSYRKNRGFYGEDAEPFEARLVDGGMWEITDCSEEIGAKESSRGIGDKARDALKYLNSLAVEHSGWVSKEDLRGLYYKEYPTSNSDSKRASFNYALKQLKKAKLIQAKEVGGKGLSYLPTGFPTANRNSDTNRNP